VKNTIKQKACFSLWLFCVEKFVAKCFFVAGKKQELGENGEHGYLWKMGVISPVYQRIFLLYCLAK